MGNRIVIAVALGCLVAQGCVRDFGRQPPPDRSIPTDLRLDGTRIDGRPLDGADAREARPEDAGRREAVADVADGRRDHAPLLQFADDFSDGVLDASFWLMQEVPPFAPREVAGHLEFTVSETVTHYSYLTSWATYDFSGRSVSVEVLQVAKGPETFSSLGVAFGPAASRKQYHIYHRYTELCADLEIVASAVHDMVCQPWDPVAHRFWRVRHDALGNLLLWETSADRKSWKLARAITNLQDLSAVTVAFSVGNWLINPAPGATIFDNFLLQ